MSAANTRYSAETPQLNMSDSFHITALIKPQSAGFSAHLYLCGAKVKHIDSLFTTT